MKRFHDTNLWSALWFRKLSLHARELQRYLWDNCDCAGVIPLDFERFSWHIGEPINEKHLAELEGWAQKLPNGNILIPTFVDFQIGDPSAACPAHRPIIKALSSHNLERIGLVYSYRQHITLPESLPSREQEKEKEKEKEKKEGVQGEPCPRLHGIPATADEVVAFGKTLFPIVSEDRCRAFFAHYEGQAQRSPNEEIFWITSGNAVVTNWKAKLPDWKAAKDNQRKDPTDEPPKKKWTPEEMVKNAL